MQERTVKAKPIVGWREWVVLPELTQVALKAKIDTGARTSTLHAFGLSISQRDEVPWADFEIHPVQRSKVSAARVSQQIVGFKKVRSSTGHAEQRPVIRTRFQIGPHQYEIDITLTSRSGMGFRMLVGRSAIRRRFWVDPGRSFLFPRNDDQLAQTQVTEHL